MLKKIILIDAILVVVFFLINYLFLILKIDCISHIYFVFLFPFGSEAVFPFSIFSLMVMFFIKKYRIFYGILNLIIIYLLFWLIFLCVISIGISRYGI
ncbi:hypothetical protein BKG99_01675 [Rodentibacter caecimuris]|uniref:Uncharacterized protein n=1 Tax=Rodentibacter caecimuris TaxID=1796644 RepID=A0AAJ3K4K6_9PAST|nr:hypothetical protein BKG90_01530 [Rodentibacter heylii]OOF78029.1 hypothetical protein BKG99_01675 [Rodentibacter heylii]